MSPRPWRVERELVTGDYEYVASFTNEEAALARLVDLRNLWPDERYRIANYAAKAAK